MYHKLKEMKSLTVLEEEIALCDKIISFKKKRGLEYDDWETKKDLAKMQLDNTKMLIESGDMDFDGYKKIIMGELAYEKKILKFTESDKISKPYELKEIKRRIEQRINVINKELTQNIEEENPETEKTSQRTQKSIHSIKKEESNDSQKKTEVNKKISKEIPQDSEPTQQPPSTQVMPNKVNNPNINQLLLIPCVILDFLCIHPFRDGNGRISRLLSLLLLYKNGFDAGKYISFEEQINNRKGNYYDALRESSIGWHENNQDYSSFIMEFLTTIYACYKELDKRFAVVGSNKITKGARVEATILNSLTPISKSDVGKILPDISIWNIRNVNDISRLFGLCKSLYYLPNISKWDLDKIDKDDDLLEGIKMINFDEEKTYQDRMSHGDSI